MAHIVLAVLWDPCNLVGSRPPLIWGVSGAVNVNLSLCCRCNARGGTLACAVPGLPASVLEAVLSLQYSTGK